MRGWIMMALLCAAAQVQAQATAASSPAKKALVEKMVQAQQAGIENIGKTLATQTAQQALQASARALPRVPAEKRDAAGKDVQAEVKKFYDEIEPQLRERASKLALGTLGPIYEERFTEAELKQILAWVQSPVSKKFQEVDADAAKALAQKVVNEMRTTVEPRLKALEKTVADRLGVPAQGDGAPPSAAPAAPGPSAAPVAPAAPKK
jgi:hypothetical protein